MVDLLDVLAELDLDTLNDPPSQYDDEEDAPRRPGVPAFIDPTPYAPCPPDLFATYRENATQRARIDEMWQYLATQLYDDVLGGIKWEAIIIDCIRLDRAVSRNDVLAPDPLATYDRIMDTLAPVIPAITAFLEHSIQIWGGFGVSQGFHNVLNEMIREPLQDMLLIAPSLRNYVNELPPAYQEHKQVLIQFAHATFRCRSLAGRRERPRPANLWR